MSIERTLGVGEAARFLGIGEATVRSASNRGDLPYETTSGGHRRFLTSDLEHFAIRRGLGDASRAQRTIIFIGRSLGHEQSALEAAGLHCVQADHLLAGIQAAQHRGMPVIVMSLRAVEEELALLGPMLGRVGVCVLARFVHEVPHEIMPQIVVREPGDLRGLTKWAWGMVKARTERLQSEA